MKMQRDTEGLHVTPGQGSRGGGRNFINRKKKFWLPCTGRYIETFPDTAKAVSACQFKSGFGVVAVTAGS